MNSKVIILLLVFAHTAVTQISFGQNKKWWTRATIGEGSFDANGKRLELQGITQESTHLVGELSLSKRAADTVPPLIIRGHLDRAGMFRANILFEVSNNETSDWKSIESSLSDKVEATLTTAPDVRSICIVVQLDAMQPYIGKYRLGRLTLQTGESTVFSLLLLTEDRGKH